MSTSWGALSADRAHRLVEAGPSTSTAADQEPSAGAWPEEMDVEFYADGAMTLPGQSEPGENCGDWYFPEFCDECAEPQPGLSRCEQRGCPNCWSPWGRRRAEKITRRLGASRYAAEEGLEKRAVHATVSPPAGAIRSLADVQRGFRTAYELAKERGVRGGVAIFHGFRVSERGKESFEDAKEAGKWDTDRDGKLWAFVRRRDLRIERGLDAGGWRDLTYWSPHWHIIGLSAEFEADEGSDPEQWRVRRIRSLESFKLHDSAGYRDMAGAARYVLSHATFESGTSSDCVRWFGELATNSFSPEEELSEGALDVVERKAREAARAAPESGESEPDECENCGSTSFSPIWEAGAALADPSWCDRVGREQQRKLSAAFEWAIGERHPPPGLRHPRSEEDAREALESLI